MKKYIYGAGKYGKALLMFFEKVGLYIDGFVQSKVERNKEVLGQPLFQVDKIPEDEKITFFLAIKDEKVTEEIESNILYRFHEAKIVNCVNFIDENLFSSEKKKNDENEHVLTGESDTSVREEMNFRSITDMSNLIRRKIKIIPKDIDLVVGVPRSGMLPASIIALLLNKPLVDINVLVGNTQNVSNELSGRINTYSYDIKQYKKILVVDDSCNSGASLEKVKNSLKTQSANAEVLFSCVYATDESKNYVDLYFEVVNLPRVFEWNILNHSIAGDSCFDLDGVLCVDPTEEQNDDGEKYREFILNAEPLFVPRMRIANIVTSRLEKYRKETEIWLEKNGIEYDHLYMLGLATKKERIEQNAHSRFKAQIYESLGAKLFIESNPIQAQDISERTNKDVYCTENNKYYHRDCNLDKYLAFNEKSRRIENDIICCWQESREAQAMQKLDELYECAREVLESIAMANDLKVFIKDIREQIVLQNGLDEISKVEIRAMIRHFSASCLRMVGKSVTTKAWEAEQRKVYREIMNYVEKSDVNDAFANEIRYLKGRDELVLYPYDFIEKYDENAVDVFWDEEKNMPFVYYRKSPLFFPLWEENAIKHSYNQLLLEQDEESPHAYFSDNISFEEGDIFVDVGSAEGIISLDVVKKAKKIFIIESDDAWLSALKNTFGDYGDKICFIQKYVGYGDADTITIDEVLKDYTNENIFLKMDVEGMELEVLYGAKKTLKNNNCKISCATYHYDESFNETKELLSAYGYDTESSGGYMMFYFGHLVMLNGAYEHIRRPFFRKAIIRAKRRKEND